MSEEVNNNEDTGGTKILDRGILLKIRLLLHKESSQSQIKFITLIFLAVGIAFSIKYALLLFISNSLIGPGGTAALTQYAVIPLFASGILAIGLSLIVGEQSNNRLSAIVVSGLGSYLGYLGFVSLLIITTRIVGSDLLSSAISLTVEGLLLQLIFAGFGVAVMGAGSGYLGFRKNKHKIGSPLRNKSGENELNEKLSENNDDGSASTSAKSTTSHQPVESYRDILTDSSTAPTVWSFIYSYSLFGVGYGILAITLGFLLGGFVAIQLSWIASVAIIFSTPLLAAYLGMKAMRTHPFHEASKIGVLGGGFGFISLIFVMIIFGAFVPDSVVVDEFAEVIGSADGFIDGLLAFNLTLIEVYFQLIPSGYEFSRILFIGAIGNAIAGGLGALLFNYSQRWV